MVSCLLVYQVTFLLVCQVAFPPVYPMGFPVVSLVVSLLLRQADSLRVYLVAYLVVCLLTGLVDC
jgi:hypothetical protein